MAGPRPRPRHRLARPPSRAVPRRRGLPALTGAALVGLPRRALAAFVGAYRSFPDTVRLLFAGQALISTGNGALFPFLALYVTERFEVDVAAAGLVTSAFFVANAVGSPIGGTLADRIGRRPIILGALVFEAVGLAGLALAPTFPTVLATVVFGGLFGAAAYPVIAAVVSDTIPEAQRGLIYGSMYQALGLGWFLGPVLGAPLIALGGYPAVFGLAITTMLVAAALFATRLPETLHRVDHHDQAAEARNVPARDLGNLPAAGAGEALAALPVSAPPASAPPAPADADPPPRTPRTPRLATSGWMRDRRLLLYVGLHLLTFGSYIQLFGIFPVDGRDRLGLAPGTWAAILAVNGAMILFGQGIVSFLVRRFHKPFAVAGGVLLWGVGFATLGLTTTAALVLPAVVVLTLGEMVVFPIQPAVVASLAPVAERARYQGALTMGGSIGNAIGPGVAGFAVAALAGGWWIALGAAMLALSLGYAAFGLRVMPARA